MVEQELAETVLRRARAHEKQIAAEAQAAEAAEAARRAAAAQGQGREPTASAGDGSPSDAESRAERQTAGDDAMGDEGLTPADQYAFLKKAGHAPPAEDGAERPPDDVVRAAYERFFDDLGASPPKKQPWRTCGQRGRDGAHPR
ncbi:unnamed protein product [Prorocentrum cordatum]|uniref:Uncharacterized protein n=1 Tax=Prorocentrum cordatum TaxID=2364126 RepID=A0ABN9UGW0_9DINO|nr:unnamed protein product [Polarella glacialis]